MTAKTTSGSLDFLRLVILIGAVVMGVLGGSGLYLYRNWRHYLDNPEPALAEPHLIEIKRGMSFHAIMRTLQDQKVISRPRLIELEARRLRVTTNMKAGEYIFHPGLTPLQVLDMITRGDITRVNLVVPEGYNIYDISRRLSTLGPWTEDGFIAAATDPLICQEAGVPIASLEGYLFPAGYSLKMSMDERTVVEIMFHRMKDEQTEQRMKRALELGMSWHQILTLASMVQKEAMQEGEMPLIAGVFHRRLKLGMPLQSDPTAIYGFKDMREGITGRDLRRKSPYNTYLNRGLPPGPICNPGAAAIKAALYPVDTEYLYFVADGRGRHLFAKNYQDHAVNVAAYRRGLRAARAEAEATGAAGIDIEAEWQRLIEEELKLEELSQPPTTVLDPDQPPLDALEAEPPPAGPAPMPEPAAPPTAPPPGGGAP